MNKNKEYYEKLLKTTVAIVEKEGTTIIVPHCKSIDD